MNEWEKVREEAKKLLEEACKKWYQPQVPDETRPYSDIYGKGGILALKHLPGVVEDAWGCKVMEDRCLVKGLFQASPSQKECDEWLATKPLVKFIAVNLNTLEEYNKDIEQLKSHLGIDVDDVRGPILGAFYPL